MKKILSLFALVLMSCMGAWAGSVFKSISSPIDITSLQEGVETPVVMYAGGSGAYGFVYYGPSGGRDRFVIDQTMHKDIVGTPASTAYQFTITKVAGTTPTYRVKACVNNGYLPGWPNTSSGAYGTGDNINGNGTYVTTFVATENSNTTNVLEGGNVYTFTANRSNALPVEKSAGIFQIVKNETQIVPLQFCTYTEEEVTTLVNGTTALPIKFSTDTKSYDYYIKCNNGNRYLNPFTFPAKDDTQRGVFRFYESTTASQYLIYEVGSGKWFTYSQTDNNPLRLIAVEDKAKANKFVVKYASGTEAPYNICPSGNQNTSFNWHGGVDQTGSPYNIDTNPATNTIGFYNNDDQNSKWLIEAVADAEVDAAELAATKAAAIAEVNSRKTISALYAEADATTAIADVNAATSIADVNTAMDAFYRSAEGKFFKFSNSSRNSEKRYVTQTATDNNGVSTTTAESPNNIFSLEYANNGLYYVKSNAVANGYWKNLDVRNGRLKATDSKATAGLWNLRAATQNKTDDKATHTVLFNANSSTGWYYMHNSTSAYVVDWVYSGSDASFWTVEEAGIEITLNYTSENNSWTASRFAQIGSEVTPASVAVDFYTNFTIEGNTTVSNSNKTFTITCEDNFPFTPGQPCRMQTKRDVSLGGDFYVHTDGNAYAKAGVTSYEDNKNVWVIEHAAGTPDIFTVRSFYNNKYLTLLSTTEAHQASLQGSPVGTSVAPFNSEVTSYFRVKRSTHAETLDGFCLTHPKREQMCMAIHHEPSNKETIGYGVGGWGNGDVDRKDNAVFVYSIESFTANLAATDGVDHYGSIYLPYTMTLPEGVEAYAATQDGAVLKLTKVGEADDVVPAGAYILYSASETSAALALGATETVSAGSNALDGRFVANVALPAGINYVLNDKGGVVGFYKYTKTTFPVAKAVFNVAEGASNAFTFRFEDVVTAIDAIHSNNGNAEIFDLQGRRLTKAQQGMNIINGHKVLVK